MIILSPTHLSEIQNHGREAYPEECCGAMLGLVQDSLSRHTRKIVRLENHWEDKSNETKHRRFAVTAQDYQALEKKAKELGLQLLGFYHTHPDHPAIPSQTDLNFAWPFFSYIILSVQSQKATEIYSYELDLDLQQFKKEELKIQSLGDS